MKNEIVALTTYGKIVVESDNFLTVQDLDTGVTFNIQGEDLIERLTSADGFGSEKSLPKTDIASLLINAWNQPFTVEYMKKDNTKRVLRGRLIKPEPLLGRSLVEDLDKEGERARLVDHRTITSLILNGVKYTVR